MSLNIEDAEAHRLARELAKRKGDAPLTSSPRRRGTLAARIARVERRVARAEPRPDDYRHVCVIDLIYFFAGVRASRQSRMAHAKRSTISDRD
ncbi:MAG: hypothetical protein FJX65_14820 [Alphaproteobacteria bacterium]|nr:hypothetical protein [Alphaproteobacteria bacterium]